MRSLNASPQLCCYFTLRLHWSYFPFRLRLSQSVSLIYWLKLICRMSTCSKTLGLRNHWLVGWING